MALIGVSSYAIAALAFGLLAVLVMTSHRGGRQGMLLASACAITALWAAVLAWGANDPALAVIWAETVEILRGGIWLGFLSLLLWPLKRANRALPILQALSVAMPLLVLLGLVAHRLWLGTEATAFREGVHQLVMAAGLGFGVMGLVLVEQLYRNLPVSQRWSTKFLCLGIGIIFAYDLYLYSDALLFRRLDPVLWHARGAVQAIAVPLIAVSIARNRAAEIPVFVSRHVAFHTATILAAGGYLLFIALGGYYIRDFGGSWGAFAQIVLTAAAAIGLVVLLWSADVRARVRVFISKHFFNNKYDYRQEWLRLAYRLADEKDGLTPYQRSISVVARIVGSPGGAVWRYETTEGGFVPASTWGTNIPDDAVIPDDDPLVTFLARSRWVVDVAEYRAHPDRYAELRLPQPVEAMSQPWALLPLLQQETLTGFIVLEKPAVDAEITWEDRDLLKTLGRQIAIYLRQHEDAQALSQARQFEAFNQLTAFLMHDLKNLIAQQSLVVRNAEKHKHNPEFVDDAMATIGNSVERMERLLEHLQRHRQGGVVERVDVARVIQDAVARCGDRRPAPEVVNRLDGHAVEADPETFTMVMVHLVRNAQDAAPDDGEVRVSGEGGCDEVVIEVVDTGAGMSREFIRNELFQPFRTTKSSKGMGIGAHQAREFVHHMGGRLSVFSTPGAGTRFRITLPVAADSDGEETASAEVQQGGGF